LLLNVNILIYEKDNSTMGNKPASGSLRISESWMALSMDLVPICVVSPYEWWTLRGEEIYCFIRKPKVLFSSSARHPSMAMKYRYDLYASGLVNIAFVLMTR
jgi:hypothetical protein